jgi:hypothetical protein
VRLGTASHLRLARTLSPADLVTVATFYMHIDAILSAGFVAGRPDPRLEVVAGETLGRSVEAASILERCGWSTGERIDVRDALKELAPKS